MNVTLRCRSCRVCVFVIVTVMGALLAAGELEDGDVIRVMTFNIRYNNPGDGANAWPHRREAVARLIGERADIAGLQEARLEQIRDIERELPGFDWFGVGRDDGQTGGEFCPIFYRRDRFELLTKETRWLSETPEIPGSRSWDAAITRIVTVVRFRDRKDGAEFYLLNTHFDHIGAEAREQSARLIRQTASQLNSRLPIVVTGDFNCTPDQKPYVVLTSPDESASGRSLIDTRTISGQQAEGPNSTWNGFREIVPGRRIDFVFVSPGVRVKRHQTLTDRIADRFPSDHLPVVAELELPRAEGDAGR